MSTYNLSYFSNLLRISKGELKSLIEKKKKQFYDLIDDKTALLLVLKDFGIAIKDFTRWKIADLFSGLKISEISVVVGKKIVEKENIVIYEVYDDTGKVKLILKEDALKIKSILFPGKIIRIRNAIVLRNRTLALFVNNDKLIKEEQDKDIIYNLSKVSEKNLPYIAEFYGKVLKITDEKTYILTDSFTTIWVRIPFNFTTNKTYHMKVFLGRDNEVYYLSEIDLEKIFPRIRL
ncbi:MAG TPA: hypothetical protein EYH09_01375 [Candidatus Nanopusillus sp.]|nr:hypothetical protein [Candidatus Nanopusillus sp.]